MSQAYIPVSDKMQALLALPAANEVIAGASLPFPIHDPCPDMTMLLHRLWFAVSPFVGLDHERHRTFLAHFGPPRSVSEIIEPLVDTLVSFLLFSLEVMVLKSLPSVAIMGWCGPMVPRAR